MTKISDGFGPTRTISPAKLFELSRSGQPVELIDVRTPAEFLAVHASIARSEPLEHLNPSAIFSSRRFKDEPLYVICQSGERAERACKSFAAAGFGDQVVNVAGGTTAWAESGLPVELGRSIWPLDRQVRAIVGLLVMLSCGLGAFASPWWYWLAAYCGLGLLFSGVTGLCPLGMAVARMPWNQMRLDPPTS